MTKPYKTVVPTESDWENYQDDVDQKWAHDHYLARTNEQMQGHFRNNPIEAADELRFMPEVPFRYYILGFRDCIGGGKFDSFDVSDAANCFLGLVLQKLEQQPRYIIPIMTELLATAEYIAANQSALDADEDIYGKFTEKLNRIRSLHEAEKDRYRNYP